MNYLQSFYGTKFGPIVKEGRSFCPGKSLRRDAPTSSGTQPFHFPASGVGIDSALIRKLGAFKILVALLIDLQGDLSSLGVTNLSPAASLSPVV